MKIKGQNDVVYCPFFCLHDIRGQYLARALLVFVIVHCFDIINQSVGLLCDRTLRWYH